MLHADGIVMGSPVYVGGVTGPTKCFIDRAGFVNRYIKFRAREMRKSLVSEPVWSNDIWRHAFENFIRADMLNILK